MLRRELNALIEHGKSEIKPTADVQLKCINSNKEPIARFLKSYAVFVSDHTAKEMNFSEIYNKKIAYLKKKKTSS